MVYKPCHSRQMPQRKREPTWISRGNDDAWLADHQEGLLRMFLTNMYLQKPCILYHNPILFCIQLLLYETVLTTIKLVLKAMKRASGEKYPSNDGFVHFQIMVLSIFKKVKLIIKSQRSYFYNNASSSDFFPLILLISFFFAFFSLLCFFVSCLVIFRKYHVVVSNLRHCGIVESCSLMG